MWLVEVAEKPEGAWDSGSRGEGSMGAKGVGAMGLWLQGQMGVFGLGQSARLKGTWVGSLWVLWDREGIRWREEVQRVRVEIHTREFLKAN